MIRAISLALLCAASFAAVYYLMAPDEPMVSAPSASISEESVPATADVAPEIGDTVTLFRPHTPAQPSSEAPAAKPVRNVTTANLTAAPPVTGPLERVEPAPVEEPKREARLERLFNPLIVAAGTIKVGDREIDLAGISATDPDQTCGEATAAWPCGRLARAALRSFIRGRAIECQVPEGADAIPNPARCLVGGDDIAAWLVAQGWAERSGSEFEEAEKTARDGKLGLFAASRPDAQPAEIAGR